MANQNVTLTTDSSIITAYVTAACATYGYSAESGLTQAQFAKQIIGQFVANVIQGYQAQQAAQSAQATAIATAQSNITTYPITVN